MISYDKFDHDNYVKRVEYRECGDQSFNRARWFHSQEDKDGK